MAEIIGVGDSLRRSGRGKWWDDWRSGLCFYERDGYEGALVCLTEGWIWAGSLLFWRYEGSERDVECSDCYIKGAGAGAGKMNVREE